MKQCSKCSLKKSLEEFGNNKSKKDGKQPYCKVCGRETDRKHYKNNSDRRSKIRQSNKNAISRNRQFVLDYLSTHYCIDCGESDPIVLEFDHLKDKRKEVSKMVYEAYSIIQIENEIAKCEVRCANCHRRKTFERFGFM